MPVVELYHRGKLVFGYVCADLLSVDLHGEYCAEKLNVALEDGQTIVAPKGRVLRIHEGNDAEKDRNLSNVIESVRSAASLIDIEVLWKKITARVSDSSVSIAELAGLAFGSDGENAFSDIKDSIRQSAVFRALSVENLYFSRQKDGGFRIISTDERADIAARLERQEQIDKDRAALIAIVDDPAHTVSPGWVERLRAWIAGGDDAAVGFVFSGADGRRSGFDLLRERGSIAWEEDFSVVEAGIERSFSVEIEDEASKISDCIRSSHSQVIDVAQFAIDDSTTTEVDDAISLQRAGEAYELCVDIADPHRFIARDVSIDRLIRDRLTSIYLPPETIYMMPPLLSAGAMSLAEGQPRPAVRYRINLSLATSPPEIFINSFEFVRTTVMVRRRIDFETVDQLLSLGNDPDAGIFKSLLQIARLLRKGRKKRGAIFVQRPELSYRVSPETKGVDISVTNARSDSRIIVGEIMILVNQLFASWAVDNSVDIIYRRQNPPEGQLFFRDNDPFSLLRSRGRLLPSFLSSTPGPHSGLGLDAYCQVTSPLRRYADLVNSRQAFSIESEDGPVYKRADLKQLICDIEDNDRVVGRIYQSSRRRWFLEYLVTQSTNRRYPGCLASRVQGGYRVYLSEFGMYGYMRAKDPQKALLRQQNFRITDVSVREGKFRCVIA